MTDLQSTLPQNKAALSVPNADNILRIALDVAEGTLKCGGSISRVEETVTRICKAYGAEHVESFAIISMISASVRLPDGTYASQMRRVRHSGNNLARQEAYSALSREICQSAMPIAEADARLDALRKRSAFPVWLSLLGAALTGGGFAIFFGGSLRDGVCAAAVSVLMVLLSRYLLFFANDMAKTLLSAMAGGLLTVLSVKIGLGENVDKIMIGAVMILITGLALGTAVQELLTDDTLSGILRLARSLLTAVMIALGFSAGILLAGAEGGFTYELNIFPPVLIAAAVVGSVGYCALLEMRPIRFPFAALAGAISICAYLACGTFLSGEFLPNLIAAAVAAAFAEICARLLHAPAAVFYTAALLPLVPGSALYYTMYNLLFGHFDAALTFAAKTAEIGLGIAAGRVLVSLILLAIQHLRKKQRT